MHSVLLISLGADVDTAFSAQRLYEPSGPLVNSEFYAGWLTHWGEIFQRVDTDAVVNMLDEMLARNASVNFFMFYGGTNFGFSAGEIIRTDMGVLKNQRKLSLLYISHLQGHSQGRESGAFALDDRVQQASKCTEKLIL
jgi:hypothetical protein